MLRRFSLYGFLKNQRYFEPFLVLAFLDKGLGFFEIGLLIGFREVMINVFEVPSGVVADLYGRRRAMITSFVAYIVSFVVFGFADQLVLLFGAMLFFAIGDAFRTGTHKAMIFSWLRSQGREAERTRVYGYTRSWSKFGSALSVVLAAVFVFGSRSYTAVFFLSVIPYLLGIVNFLGYPASLDGQLRAEVSASLVIRRLWTALRGSVTHRGLRRLILESMGFEGVFRAVKDYLQPVLQAAAAVWIPVGIAAVGGGWDASALSEAQQAALLVGPVFFVLHLLSGIASRRAHQLVDRAGSEARAARWVWAGALGLYVLLLPSLAGLWFSVAIVGFVALHVLQNLWRPILIGRFDVWTPEEHGATVLSIESQSKSVATTVFAPLLGLAVDAVVARGVGGAFWPLAALGIAVSAGFWLTGRRTPRIEPARF